MEVAHLLPKIFVNSFPKSGTHLAVLLITALAQPQTRADGKPQGNWFGTFKNNAFSDEWVSTQRATAIIAGQQPGTWMKGHAGYLPEFLPALHASGTCMIFIYRDLRDVAVSLVHHIEGEKKNYAHAEREIYAHQTHEEKLLSVIAGHPAGHGKDPGLIKRWELYAGWLTQDWVYKIKYEDILRHPERAARNVLEYVIKRTCAHQGKIPVVRIHEMEKMVRQALYYMDNPQQYSPTYRKGKAGSWRTEFTSSAHAAFDNTGGNKWLERLGYPIRRSINYV